MSWISASLRVVLSLSVIGLAADTALARQGRTTQTEVRPFQVVWVDGNTVILRGDQGAQEITVPDDFRFTVDGRQVSVRELRPGMKGTATITTTTTVTPVEVTEVRNGEVLQVAGNSIMVREADGVRRYTEAQANQRNAQIIRNGRPARFRDLRRGDRLSATIVTSGEPEVVTEKEVEATLAALPAPAARVTKRATVAGSTPASADSASPGAAAAPSGAARTLPSTASPLPLVGLLGAVSLAIGSVLTARRRRRAV